MGLETGTYLDDLIITNPIGAADFVSVGDDHLRFVKKALKNSFPGQTFPIGLVTDTGVADAYAGAMSPAPASLINGTIVMFKALNANTGASTFNLNALGTQSITKYGSTALAVDDIKADQNVILQYNLGKTDWEMISQPGSVPTSDLVDDTTPQLGGVLDTNAFAIDESEGANIASAATTNLMGMTDGDTTHITGTVTITSLGTASKAGIWRKGIFDGILVLTDGANLNLQGNVNITTAVDDFIWVYAETTTLFKVLYFKADGSSPVPSSSGFGAGDVKLTFKTTADNGWVLMDDGSIGSATSGGTTRANADTETLFKLLWDNTTDAECPVTTGRGASAQADFDANKNITLPLVLGRALAITGSGAGLTARTHADTVGEETHVQSNAELSSHTHTVRTFINTAGGVAVADVSNSQSAGSTILTNSTGSSTGFNVVQPTTFLNVMIKL